MIITSTTQVRGTGGNPRKAGIEKQIRRLEKKKRELLKKLTGQGNSDADNAAGLAGGTVTINQQSVASPGAGLCTGGAAPGNTQAQAGKTSGYGGIGVQDLSALLRNMQSMSPSGPELPELDEDPKEIMKKIQLIEMQIMMLREQLGDDALVTTEMLDDDEDAGAQITSALAARLEAGAASPEPEVANGHVDGYL